VIRFCCPACCVSLSVKKAVAGGHVNCPNCQKLILIPELSPFDPETNPFEADQTHRGPDVAKAVSICVEPYRKELEAKSTLLNDAVEMVRVRNLRIREIESLLLRVQCELWAMEVDRQEEQEVAGIVDRRLDTALKSLRRMHRALREEPEESPEDSVCGRLDELEKRLAGHEEQLSSGGEKILGALELLHGAGPACAALRQQIRSLQEEIEQMRKRSQTLEQRQSELKNLLREAIGQMENRKE
jgi:chromosome segregation ATPase